MAKTFRESVEEIHEELWKETVSRFDLREEEPEGMCIANVASYSDGYVTTVAQYHLTPSDMVNIGIELVTSGVMQLTERLLESQETTDDEDLKELTPIDVCEAGIEKVTNQLRSRVRRIMTDRLMGRETEGRTAATVRVSLDDGEKLSSGEPTDGPVQ